MSTFLTVLEGIGWYCAASLAFGAVLGLVGYTRNRIRERAR
ncbi:hypothetical protein AB0D99_32040 [Streptomyces sp. NPDC047971]